MSIKRRFADYLKVVMNNAINILLLPVGNKQRERFILELVQDLIPLKKISLLGNKSMILTCPGYDVLFRVEEFFVKEPETLRWIDTFQDGDIFWDIGANIGVYSLYAAVTKGIQVCAFEPSSANYWVLNKNIEINHLDECISAYCIALSESQKIGSFNMGDTNFGGAYSQFSESKLKDFNYAGVVQSKVLFNQAMISFSLDEFIRIYKPPFPTHIKIDIDGYEDGLVKGCSEALYDKRLKSVLIELNGCDEAISRILDTFKRSGFSIFAKEHAPQFDEGKSKNFYNYIFIREELMR